MNPSLIRKVVGKMTAKQIAAMLQQRLRWSRGDDQPAQSSPTERGAES